MAEELSILSTPSSASPPTLSQLLSFSHTNQHAGSSHGLTRRSETDPGDTTGHTAKRARESDTATAEREGGSVSDTAGDSGGYRRPPAPTASSSARGQRSRLQLASESRSSFMSIASEGDTSDNDFAPQRTVSRTASSVSGNMVTEVEAGEESSTCPICFEGWTASGGHRLASLKCGHLFGRSCIRKWLSQSQKAQQGQRTNGGGKCCPECKQVATVRDIRVLFARSVTAVDGARVEELAAENKRLGVELSALRGKVAEHTIRHHQMLNEVKRLRTELDAAFEKSQWLQLENANLARRVAELTPDPDSRDESDTPGDLDQAGYVPRLRLRATVAVAADDGQSSRVLAVDPYRAVIYASHSVARTQQHTMAVVDVHGAGTRTPPLVSPHLHTMEIRGAEVSPHAHGTQYLLTASHDKTVVLTALGADGCRAAPKLAARLQLGALGWACAWDMHDAHRCYVGTASSTVLAFDLRYAAQPLHLWSGVRDGARLFSGADDGPLATGYSQIHAIAVVRGAESPSRLVVANANHVYALPDEPGALWQQLTQPGPCRACYALSYDSTLGCVAASFRTTAEGAPTTVHDLYATSADADGLSWRLLQSIPAASPQTKLARSAVFSFAPAGQTRRVGLFCAVLEAARAVNVWPVGGTLEPTVLADVLAPEDIVDVRGGQWADTAVLASLTNSTIRLYDVR
ncbi:RING finger and WD repeat domain-containing protein 3 [Coemansia sp. BCRC 34301]|nr:RING finger and WD repeat domain-containing protein 3 [Coemansia sp. BCRC 34301]